MITTKTIYITTDGTEFSESKYSNAQKLAEDYEERYLQELKFFETEVICLTEQGRKTDYENADYVRITSLEGVEALKAFCEKEGFFTPWDTNKLDEKPGLYMFDCEKENWSNLDETILKLETIKKRLENF